MAGTGTDAAPYFRIFNPVEQGKKFDPNGDYVRRWIPELRQLSGAAVHEPWRSADGRLYNAYNILSGGRIIAQAFKHALPNVEVFDELRNYAQGDIAGPVRIGPIRNG